MLAEIGQFTIIAALVIAIIQATVPLLGAARQDTALIGVGRSAAVVQLVLIGIAFLCLTQLYITSDFSVLNVWQNSHSEKPLLYKISGVWGNHEGSLLLWVLILALFGAAVALFGNNLPPSLRARVLAVQAMIGVGFLALLIFTSNPFARISPAPANGNGLNPLLQDPGLAFHPPFLYLGYVGFSIAFSFAVAALLEGKVDAAWARWVRPWTLAAWSFLTVGIAMGSWWAYYELGWGGWWFWDPVENASFMPWLIGTALLHSAIVVEKRNSLKSWTILLAILTFSFSLLGTFIVRSGVLNSVHSFATDPGRGVFILALLILAVGSSLALYAWRAPSLKGGGLFAPISREGALVLNNLLLIAATATVFLGTIYPLLLDAFTGEKVSVGPPFFHATFVPLMIPLILTMAVGPMLPWKRSDLTGLLSRLKFCGLVTLFVGIYTLALSWDGPVLAVCGMMLGAWVIAGTIADLFERTRLFNGPLRTTLNRARHLPRSNWGAACAHAGMGLAILGITGSIAFETERLQVMKPGDQVDVANYSFVFEGAKQVQGPNYAALRGKFQVRKAGKTINFMEPESRSYTDPPMVTTEAAILPKRLGDLYVVLGEPTGKDGFATRLYHKPMINCLWLGCLMMLIGGLVSLSDRKHRVGAPQRRKNFSAPAPALKR